ncbi:hypothetical protein F8O04_05080 [Pseudoclavibacter endophyticus]|uniref:NADH:flavin oxidoreductase/NADH oxidase N-terminal domain-containing protein n=1 Tax=Pseudoclavibacter endophyticus TaxID=1778590 RepID=A0A6H9WTM8_9MICO|nr:hypothetical protein F8O04_05080 [Pseudoclavibacter endophyticus]
MEKFQFTRAAAPGRMAEHGRCERIGDVQECCEGAVADRSAVRAEAPDLGALFTPRRLAGVTLPNRFIMPGMQRGWCENGAPDARLATYYRARAEGGVGLIISESVAVDHPSATRSEFFARLTPSTLPAWKSCVGAVKDAGGHMLLQLWHEGRSARSRGATRGRRIRRSVRPVSRTPAGRTAGPRRSARSARFGTRSFAAPCLREPLEPTASRCIARTGTCSTSSSGT